ncbi:small nuclear ribonucleoprotein G-like [Marmota monax]|uniref:small nuclear ribonucleoprotein G-like n=1 Tax=Marmota monax TaxID=9995 RepID=UPI001EAFEC52|nr:small nuclear ribonucleoprotein G-like [Marmota monax]
MNRRHQSALEGEKRGGEMIEQIGFQKKKRKKLNGGRHVQGILQGFDPFMNLVIDECVEMATSGQQNNIGMVVIRGNSIIMLEALERL